jgi:hypothetical protein
MRLYIAEIRFAIVMEQTNNKWEDPHKEDWGVMTDLNRS